MTMLRWAHWARHGGWTVNDVVLTGQGADRSLREELSNPASRVMGATTYHPERYGEQLIRLALKILRGEPAPPAVNIEHSFISQRRWCPAADTASTSLGRSTHLVDEVRYGL